MRPFNQVETYTPSPATPDPVEETPENNQSGNFNYEVVFFFSIIDRNELIDKKGVVFDSENLYKDPHVIHTIAWQYPGTKKYESRKTDKFYFIDCSDISCKKGICSLPDNDKMLEKMGYALDLLSGLLSVKTVVKKQGKLNVTICSTMPVEGLTFAMASVFGKNLPNSALYQSLINKSANLKKIISNYEGKDWSFNVDFGFVYEDYILAIHKKTLKERRDLLRNLWNKVVSQNTPNTPNNRKWMALDHKMRVREHKVAGLDYPKVNQVEYYGKFYTAEELQPLIDDIEAQMQPKPSGNKNLSYPEAIDDAYKDYIEACEKHQPELDDINMARQKLMLQQRARRTEDEESNTYFKAYTLGRRMNAGSGVSYHDREQIEFNGEFVTLDDLNKLDAKHQGEISKRAARLRQLKSDYKKYLQDTEKARLRMVLGLASIIMSPLALVDAAIEVQEMMKDGNLDHLWTIGIDIVCLLPIAGGAAKITHLATKAGRAVKNSVKVEKTVVAFERGEKVVNVSDDVMVGAKGFEAANKDAAAEYAKVETQMTKVEQSAQREKQAVSRWNNTNAAQHPDAPISVKEKGIRRDAVNATNDTTRELNELNNMTEKFIERRNYSIGKRNELSYIIYSSEQESIISIANYVQDAYTYFKNFNNLTGKGKFLAGFNLAKDATGNIYTVVGVMQNGYFLAQKPEVIETEEIQTK